MKSKIIAITGKARHGKDTAANIIKEYCKEQGKLVHTLAFADKLKEMSLDFLGISSIETLNWLKNDNVPYCVTLDIIRYPFLNDTTVYNNGSVNIRRFLQVYADFLKESNPSFFVDELRKKLDVLYSMNYDIIIITDLRLHIEEDMVNSLNDSKILKIVRKTDDIEHSNHNSETEINEILPDIVLFNNTDLTDLQLSTVMLIKSFCK